MGAIKLAIRNDTNIRGWLRISSAAQYLDVSVRTVRRLLGAGLPHVRIPGSGTILISVGQLDAWLVSGGLSLEGDGVDELAFNLLKEL